MKQRRTNPVPRLDLSEHDLLGKPLPGFPDHALQRFPVISDHQVIQYDRKAP
jgi:hypothetical protein